MHLGAGHVQCGTHVWTVLVPAAVVSISLHHCRGLVPGAKVEVAILDLANQASIKDFASRALDIGSKLDVLINNAGRHLPALA